MMERRFEVTASSTYLPKRVVLRMRFSQGTYDAAEKFASMATADFDVIPGGEYVGPDTRRYTLVNQELGLGLLVYVKELT